MSRMDDPRKAQQPNTQQSLLSLAAGGVLGLSFGVLGSWLFSSHETPPVVESGEREVAANTACTEPRTYVAGTAVKRAAATRAHAVQSSEDDDEAEKAATAQPAKEAQHILGNIFERVERAAQIMPGRPDEAVFSDVAEYQRGMLAGVLQIAPELAPELSHEISRTLCDPKASNGRLLVAVNASRAVRDVAEPDGFDCIAKRGKEDFVLWSALDAWRASELPPTAAIEALERSAKDERTLARFRREAPEQPPAAAPADAPASPPDFLTQLAVPENQ